MRISRPCYDKYHRCPGWAGGGMKYAKAALCPDGSIQVNWEDRHWAWKFWKCNKCNVVVLPYNAKYLMSLKVCRYFIERKTSNWWTLKGEILVFRKIMPKVGYYSKRYWEPKE